MCENGTTPPRGGALEWLARRPSVLLFGAVAAGILAAESVPAAWALGLLAGTALTALLLRRGRAHHLTTALVLLALAAGAHLYTRTWVNRLTLDPLARAAENAPRVQLLGRVQEEPIWYRDGSRRFRLRVHAFATEVGELWKSGASALVTVRKWVNTPFHAGDELTLEGRIFPIRGRRNPGDFDRRRYWLARGAVARLSLSRTDQVVRTRAPRHRSVSASLLSRATHRLYALYPVREAGLLEGLLLGRRGMLDPALRARFADLGVVHILAVSGLHVGYVVAGLMFLLSLLRIPGKARWLLLVAGVFLYAHLTGGKPPVVRASAMASLVLLAEALERRYDLVNALALAGTLILLHNPLELRQVGFLLSFSAVLSIALVYPRVRRIFPERWSRRAAARWATDLAAVSLAAQIGTLPLTLLYFGKLPVWGLIANLFVVPVAGVAVALGFFSLFLSALWSAAAQFFATACWGVLIVLEHFVTFASRMGFGALEVGPLPAWWVVGLWLVLVAAILNRWPRNLKVALFGILLLSNAAVWAEALRSRSGADVYFLDVGLGDACLVRFGNGKALLVDAGDAGHGFDNGARVVLPTLRSLGVRRLDAVIVSHGHQDHVGGLPSILRKLPVGRIYWDGVPSEAPGWREAARLADSLGIPLIRRSAGDTIGGFEPAVLAVVGPGPRLDPEDLNNASLAVLLRCREGSVLFTGDAEREEEAFLCRYAPILDVDVLKVAHHGSATSTTPEFLRAVRPEIAVISASRFNRFGFPSRTVVDRLVRIGCNVLQTGRTGAVRVKLCDGPARLAKW